MKILVVCQYFYPEQFRINDMCFTLAAQGHDVTVLTGLPNYPKGRIYKGYGWPRKKFENISGVKVIRVPLIGRGSNIFCLMLNYVSFMLTSVIRALFLKRDFDIVYVYQLSPVTMALPALLYKKLTGKKVLLYCLDIWPESIAAAGIGHSSYMYRILLKLSRKIYQGVDRVLVTSKSFAGYLQEVVGVGAEHIGYLPQYAEAMYLFDQSEEAGEKDGMVNLLFAGNIGEMQSVETIIKAADELREIDNIKWHIVGDGSARKKCEELASYLELGGKVVFYGQRPVSEMPEFYSKAAALLVTLKDNSYISYTLPGKVQSYMAAGKPIIGAIGGETRRVIEEACCGLCCEAEDYRALADNVRKFAADEKKAKEYAINSRRYYECNFDKDLFINSLIYELNETAGGKKACSKVNVC